jgi:hypothetical protein
MSCMRYAHTFLLYKSFMPLFFIVFLDEQCYRHSREGRFRISSFGKRSAEGRGTKVKG